MNVFVTGATGFIGEQLVRALVQRGEQVHVLCRATADLSILNEEALEVFRGDILDAASVVRAMEGCERVFHIAGYARNWAKDGSMYYRANVDGTKNVFDAALAHAVNRVVFTSTSVTLGPSNGVATTESTRRKVSCFTEYENSKLQAEEEVDSYLRRGLDVVVVNPTRVFGPGLLNEGNSLTKMIQLYLNGKWRLILGDGQGVGNYGYVEDIVRGHLLAMDRGLTGERYILGGENISYNEFFDLLADVSKKRFRMLHMPSAVALGYSYIEKSRAAWFNSYPLITPGWVRTFLADWAFNCEKARRDLGYPVTPLRTALSTTVNWLQQFHISDKEVSK